MSRPTTRSKNKRTRPCSDSDSSSELLRKIHVTGEITEDDVRQLYLIWKPICQSCRVNLKDSPNCFCGLAPPPNGSRKYGLWQRMSEIIQSLGPDPCKDCRSMDSPAGLTNLGATCYANSILQCLYMNRPFREGIFSVEMDLLKQHAVMDQLFRLFAHLHYSKMAFIDSAPFIKTLELDNGVQQDSHEFFTLFLSLLERSLSHSKVPHARTIVQDLFRGSVSHVTQCSVCGKESEASSKMEDFYELELNIKGLNNLDQSLEDYLSVEKLQGENQYFCESCCKRVDATRFIKLQRLPAVLNFQLKRCVFLPKTTTKKKITSAFSFPRRLHISLRLHDTPEFQSELTYDLQAILIHRGTAVNSGHYVAHIKDKSSGQWWEFDDEHVSKLGLHPFGAESSTSAQPERSYQTSSEQAHYFGNGNHVNNFHSLSPDLNITSLGDMFSSTDAYMLMYNRITTDEDMEKFSRRNSLPFHLLEDINEQNASYNRVCQEYQQRKDGEINNIMERRQEVRSVLSEAPVLSVEDPFYWISADWLRQWADSTKPLPIDNTPIQCSHGKAPASKVGYMKRVSTKAWNSLYTKYGGGPVLSSSDCCTLCLKDEAENTVVTDTYRDRRAGMKQLAEAALAGQSFDGNQYYLSKTWLLQWLRRKNFDSPCDANSGPTASIQCPHGKLLPEQVSGAKRLLVPEDLWYFIFECATAAKPDDLSGCLTFPSDSEACTICSMEMTEVACLEDNLRAAKLKQRQNHEKLSQGKPIALYPGCKYYLVPSLWLCKWRIYVMSSGKNASSSTKPDGLEGAIDSIKCVKHSRLLERPLDLTCKRGGGIVQRASATDGLTLITESDWKLFCEEWQVPDVKAIVAEIDIENCKLNKLDGSREELPSSEAPFNPSGDGLNSELEGKPIVRTLPEVCEDCIGERESQQLMQKLNYQNEDIRVFFVHGKEVPRSVLEASGTIFEPDRRTSKRSRRNSTSSSIDLKVSGSTSIYQLKMMIWESFGVVKENQKLHKGSREIDADESATLADRNIFPGDVLWVTDTEIYENRDIADELSGPKESWQAEEGFRGTLLTSDALCQGVKGAST